MGNIDIDEWLLNNGFNPLLISQEKNGKDFFLSDILERHLKEQLIENELLKLKIKRIESQQKPNKDEKDRKAN